MCHCGSPSYPGDYRVACEGISAQAIVDLCSGSGSEQLELLILCVSESRARELLRGEGLKVASQRLTVILVNRSDVHLCPLHKRVDSGEITAKKVQHSGTCQLDTPHEMHPDVNATQGRNASVALLSLLAVVLISAVIGIWFVTSYLRRCFKQCERLPIIHFAEGVYVSLSGATLHACIYIAEACVCHSFLGHTYQTEA